MAALTRLIDRVADVEGGRPAELAVDTVAGGDAVDVGLDRDVGAGLPVVRGRQCTSESLIQRQAPFWPDEFVTERCFSMAFLSATGTSKRTMTGIPTPTVEPATGAKLG